MNQGYLLPNKAHESIQIEINSPTHTQHAVSHTVSHSPSVVQRVAQCVAQSTSTVH